MAVPDDLPRTRGDVEAQYQAIASLTHLEYHRSHSGGLTCRGSQLHHRADQQLLKKGLVEASEKRVASSEQV